MGPFAGFNMPNNFKLGIINEHKNVRNHSYTRQEAAYPHSYLLNNKYWSPVSRIDNVYGDRNLFCVYPPIEEYEEVKTE